MAKRKVDEALDVMRKSIHEWNMAARKIIRYGNIEDFEELHEELSRAVELAHRLVDRSMDDSVQGRHQHEIDRIHVEGLIRGK